MQLSTANSQRTTAPSLRFKRWSRKKYAAFVSIQREVTIGHLAVNVSDRFQVKNSSLHAIASLSSKSSTLSDEKSHDFPKEVAEILGSLSTGSIGLYIQIMEIQATTSKAAAYTYYIISFRKSGRFQHQAEAFRFFFVNNHHLYDS